MSTRKKTNEGAAGTAAEQNELEPMASGGAAENAENTETRKADTPEEQGNETAGKMEDAGTAGGKPDEPQTAEADIDTLSAFTACIFAVHFRLYASFIDNLPAFLWGCL